MAPLIIVLIIVMIAFVGFTTVSAQSGGVTTFLALTDTPSTFSAGEYVKVNAGGTALEYDTPSGAGDITGVGDVTDGEAFATGSGKGTSLYFYDAQGEGELTLADLTAARTWTLPDVTGALSALGQTIGVGELVEEDFGDFTVTGGSATLDTGVVADNEIDYSAVTLADFDYQTAWRLFYSNADGDVTELALGGSDTYLKSTGASGAPEWDTPGGSGDITDVGDASSGSTFTADGTGNNLWFEGATPDTWEIILSAADPSGADFTATLQAFTGYLVVDTTACTDLEGDHLSITTGTLNVADDWWNAWADAALASSYIVVGNGDGAAAAVAMSGDVTISNTGVTTIGADKVDDTNIDWGVGANQVDTSDMTTRYVYRSIVWYIPGNLTTGQEKGATIRLDEGLTALDVTMHVKTAPTGADLIIDINEDGTSIFTGGTRTQVDAGDYVEDDAPDIGDTSLADGAEITLDIDQTGSSVAGADMTVTLECKGALMP